MDKSSNQRAGVVAVVLQSPEGDLIECAVHLQFPTTNKEVEYEAFLTGLDLAKAARASSVVVHSDSQVIVRYINRDYEAKGERIKEYLSMVEERVSQKFLARLMQILREESEQTDRLAKVASVEHMVVNSQVLSFVQNIPAIDKIDVQVIPIGVDWMMPKFFYL